MAREFDPGVRENLSALVRIAKYHDTPLIQQSIKEGHYGSVNLEQAQHTLLSLRSVYPQLGQGLPLTEGYHPETFEALIGQFREIRTANQRLLVDEINEAIIKNDISLLEHFPFRTPTESNPEQVPLSPPPATGQSHKPEASESSRTSEEKTSGESDSKEDQSGRKDESEQTEENARPDSTESGKKPDQNSQNSQSQLNSNYQAGQRPGYKRPASSLADTEKADERARLRERVKNRRRKAFPGIRPKPSATGGGSGAAGALNDYWSLKDLAKGAQSLADRLGLKGLSSAIEKLFAPERWLGQLGRSALRLGGQLARSALNGLTDGITGIGEQLASSAAANTARSFITGATEALAGISIVTVLAWITIAALVIFTIWSLYDSSSECGKPGTIEAVKSSDKDSYVAGETINYRIRVIYNLKCTNAYADIVVKDNIPASTDFTPTSLNPLDPFFYLGSPAGDVQGNTIVWTLNKVQPNAPINLVFSVKPRGDDVWIANQATVNYKTYSTGLFGIGNNPTGGGNVPDGAEAAANRDTCGGKYSLRNPKGNYGDPLCNFEKDALFAQLKQVDPADADYWFNTVVYKETGGTYDPNAFNPGSSSGRGAYGLFQMNPTGGGNGEYDAGDVAWQRQTTNAVNYNNLIRGLGIPWCYWEAAKDRWGTCQVNR